MQTERKTRKTGIDRRSKTEELTAITDRDYGPGKLLVTHGRVGIYWKSPNIIILPLSPTEMSYFFAHIVVHCPIDAFKFDFAFTNKQDTSIKHQGVNTFNNDK